jgi:alpha-L-arabinofuranosidase
MDSSHIRYDLENDIGYVDPRIFGGFIENMGRAVCQDVFDPTSVHA